MGQQCTSSLHHNSNSLNVTIPIDLVFYIFFSNYVKKASFVVTRSLTMKQKKMNHLQNIKYQKWNWRRKYRKKMELLKWLSINNTISIVDKIDLHFSLCCNFTWFTFGQVCLSFIFVIVVYMFNLLLKIVIFI